MISRSDALAMDRLRRRSRKIRPDELYVVEVTERTNARSVRCSVSGCGRLCKIGQGLRVYIAGEKRGFMCPACRRGGR